MIRIAICDDYKPDIKRLEAVIWDHEKCPENVVFYPFSSGKDLIDEYEGYDAVFLDIQMEGMGGERTAQELRRLDSEVLLLFYTNYEKKASQILQTHPFSYIRKNDPKQINLALWDLFEELEQRRDECKIPIPGDARLYTLYCRDILFIDILNKGTRVWITEKRAREMGLKWDPSEGPYIKSSTTLDQYEQQLKTNGLFRGARSYLLNAQYIEVCNPAYVRIKGGKEFNISRLKREEFNKNLAKYWGTRYKRGEEA